MPTVLRVDSARFYFYSNEGSEPPHVHVERSGAVAKFWLDPVVLATSKRFSSPELRRLERIVVTHRDELLEKWHAFFST